MTSARQCAYPIAGVMAAGMGAATIVVDHPNNGPVATDPTDRLTQIVPAGLVLLQAVTVVTTAAVDRHDRVGIARLVIAARAVTAPQLIVHRATDHSRIAERKGMERRAKVVIGHMCPTDRHNRLPRAKGSNSAKSAGQVIHGQTMHGPTAIDRRVIGLLRIAGHKAMEHRARAVTDRLCGRSNAPNARNSRVSHVFRARVTAATTFRSHRPHQPTVETPSRCAAADGGQWGIR
jgi:hypothetical protein